MNCTETKCMHSRTIEACHCFAACCRCCPNGCYFKIMVKNYPNYTHHPDWDYLCGVCVKCVRNKSK